MTIDYKALAGRIEDHASYLMTMCWEDEVLADLRTVVSLLNGMVEEKPQAYIECAIFGQADDELVWEKGAVGHYIPLFTRPAPQPQPDLAPDPYPDEPEWEAPVEPTEAQIEAVANVLLTWVAEIPDRVSARVLAEDVIDAALTAKESK